MVSSLLGARQVAQLKVTRQRGFQTVQQFWDDGYACWTVNRPAGWSDGAGVESLALIEMAMGKLYEQGAGGPQSGEQVIHVESPYRLRTLATSLIDTGHLLVINGARLFRVDLPKREGDDDVLMNVYLTELFNTPMPGAA